jgi:hypothetical protein
VHPQLRRRRDHLWELKDRWSQPPPRKVGTSATVAAQWAGVMVGYNEFETVRQEAQTRAKRIWGEREWERRVERRVVELMLQGERDGGTQNVERQEQPDSDNESEWEHGGEVLDQAEEDNSSLAQLEDLCEDLDHLHYG